MSETCDAATPAGEADDPWVTTRLGCESTRGLLRTMRRLRGPDGVIRRRSFGPEDLKPWLGEIAIHQWDGVRGDYVYRLFGTHLAENLGRDLTGLTLSEWPASVGQIMRDQAHQVIALGRPVISHYRLKVIQRDGRIEDRVQTQEKVVVPIAYSEDGPPDAVLAHVDQARGDLVVLRSHMDMNDGSCWCIAGRPRVAGCPFA